MDERKEVVLIGVTQEQHPQRCELFAQWHQFDWPILHDPVNLLGNSAVPMTIAIDEHGVVRSTRPNPRTLEKDFLKVDFDPPKKTANSIGVSSDWKTALKLANESPNSLNQKNAGDSMLLWGNEKELDAAIKQYKAAVDSNPKDPSILFRLGVAYQMRNESEIRQDNDFSNAILNWQKALSANPNQYIWRRRIQQYGPRLDKPYPFYDWVEQARKEITSRGETPIKLPVEPVGAELASKSRSLKQADAKTNPDPDGKITQDSQTVIQIRSIIVPHTYKPKSSAMVHVELTPKPHVTWSNEAGPLEVWVEGKRIQQSQKLFRLTNSAISESSEKRKIEFEIVRPADSNSEMISGFALYYVCEKEGQCKYLRQDFQIRYAK